MFKGQPSDTHKTRLVFDPNELSIQNHKLQLEIFPHNIANMAAVDVQIYCRFN